jgi:hypothetical protein
MATFSVHYDGPITVEHHVSVRTLARTYEHMQRAIDRAYLINRHGNVWKHARLKAADYQFVDFMAAYPREGGIVLDAIKLGQGIADQIVDRIGNAIAAPFERALNDNLDDAQGIAQEIAERRNYVQGMGARTMPFKVMLDQPPAEWAALYSDRSILKEVDQITHPISSPNVEGSIVELSFHGNQLHPVYQFTAERARRFHQLVAKRELGPALVVNARIRDLDRGNQYAHPKAKIINLDSGREVILHLQNQIDVAQLHPFHMADHVRIYACPFIEGGGFDLKGGDLYFIGVANA